MLYFNQAKKRTNRFVPMNSREMIVFKSTSVEDYKDSFFGAIMVGKSMNLCSQGNQLSKSISQKIFPEKTQFRQVDEINQLQTVKSELISYRSMSPRDKIRLASPNTKNISALHKNIFTPVKSEENFDAEKTPTQLIDQKLLIDEEETKVSNVQTPNLIKKHQSYSRKKFQQTPPQLKSKDMKRETVSSSLPWLGPANDSEAKLEKRMTMRSELFDPKKQNTVPETEIATEEDKKYISIYFKHKTVSLLKITEEKLKKFNIWPKYRKKTGKITIPDIRDVADGAKKDLIWASLKKAISTKSKYKYRDVIHFEKKIMNTFKELNEVRSSKNKKNSVMVELVDDYEIEKRKRFSKSPEKTRGAFATDQEKEFALKKSQNPNIKTFIILGGYQAVRQALEDRGWIENPDKSSKSYDFRWSTRKLETESSSLGANQLINHFGKNAAITTKNGLCRSLKNLIWFHKDDVDKFYPRCFDLNDVGEFDDFVEDFKFSEAEKYLKTYQGAITEEKKSLALMLKVLVSLNISEKRLQSFDTIINQLLRDNYEAISTEEWEILTSANISSIIENNKYQKLIDFIQEKFTLKLATLSDEDVFKIDEKTNETIQMINEKYCQSPLNLGKNIWIVKPAGLSRGRGIACHSNLPSILDHIKCKDSEWIAQKYLENLLIVKNRKFDIRQWVLVTDWDPLTIWFYERCYIRFAAEDYNVENLGNRYAHLTNNSVVKYSENFDASEIEGNMWFDEDLANHLKEYAGYNVFEENIRPAMKNAVIKSLLSVQDMIENRKNSFEIYGYDFMIDNNLDTWLIEINSSPSMEYSTHVTEKLVQMVLEDAIKVVVDYGQSKKKSKKDISTGNFTRIYKGK